MKFILFAVIAVVLPGCDCGEKKTVPVTPSGCERNPVMTNEEIIAVTKQCETAGLSATSFHCGDNHLTTHIQCEPISK